MQSITKYVILENCRWGKIMRMEKICPYKQAIVATKYDIPIILVSLVSKTKDRLKKRIYF